MEVPPKSGKNKKLSLFFLLITPYFMFMTYQGLKNVGVDRVSEWAGRGWWCTVTDSGPWTTRLYTRSVTLAQHQNDTRLGVVTAMVICF